MMIQYMVNIHEELVVICDWADLTALHRVVDTASYLLPLLDSYLKL
jgi:hypothetical protein